MPQGIMLLEYLGLIDENIILNQKSYPSKENCHEATHA